MSVQPKLNLADLEAKAEILHPHLRNLAISLGVFHGINDRLRARKLSGTGSGTIATIMFDQIHLIAIRIHALILEPKYPSDVSIGTFAKALRDDDVRQQIIDNTSSWYGPSHASSQRQSISERIETFLSGHSELHSEEAAKLKKLRDKVLAHISTEADIIAPVVLNTLWDLGARTLSLGGEVSLIFKGTDKTYQDDLDFANAEAQKMVDYVRAGIEADNKRLTETRQRRATSLAED